MSAPAGPVEPSPPTVGATGSTMNVNKKYTAFRAIGRSSFGLVFSATNGDTCVKVAIKKVRCRFYDYEEERRLELARKLVREVKLMKHLAHENILALLDIEVQSDGGFTDVYLMSEWMQCDLEKVIQSAQALTPRHIQYFLYQILRALKYMHSANVLHCDLKPHRIFLNSDCSLKISYFGRACGIGQHPPTLPEDRFVVTRWYCAPETMLGCEEYSPAADVWAVGCIFGELLRRKPVFPGQSSRHQLTVILDCLGLPEESDLSFITCEDALDLIRRQRGNPASSLETQFGDYGPQALDLLFKLLAFNPNNRISVDTALQHPYLALFHRPDDEPVAESVFSHDWERVAVNSPTLRKLLLDEALDFHPEARLASELTSGGVTVADASQHEPACDRRELARNLARCRSSMSAPAGSGEASLPCVIASGQTFNINKKYRVVKYLGRGPFAVSIAAENTETCTKVVIKKLRDCFSDPEEAQRLLRDVKLMKHFRHKNIVALLDIELPPAGGFTDVYLVSELMETDLHRVIYSRQKLSPEHVQYFLYQILCALKCIHSAGVLHWDLKPSNILLNANCDLKISDFSLARSWRHPDTVVGLTESYEVARYYCAPESMLMCKEFSPAVDVWAVGCIFGEMLRQKPMFPGSGHLQQLKLIVECLGTPEEEDLKFITSERALAFIRKQRGMDPAVSLEVLYGRFDTQALDLLYQLLRLDPSKRISVEAALEHPYLASLHDPEDEPVAGAVFSFDWEGATTDADTATLQRLILDEALDFHPEARLATAVTSGGVTDADASMGSTK